MKTKLFSLLVALIAATTLFASDIQVDGIWYDFDNTKLTASVTYRGSTSYSYSNEYTGSVVIPASVSYNSETYSVETIGEWAFDGCSGLTSVTIPKSVTTIGEGAFWDCTGLTKTNYTGTIADWCKIKFDFPNSTNPIFYSHNFYINDIEVKDLVIPESVTGIAYYAFYGCSSLTSVTIPSSVTTIGDDAFGGCSGLTSVTLGNSVTTIRTNAFYNVNNIVYSGTATGSPWGAKCVNGYVEGYLVYSDATKTKLCGCSSAATGAITIPNSVTTIGKNAFEGCRDLTSVTIPNSVTTIGKNAFEDCSGLTSVTIPKSVTKIESGAFRECIGLTSVIIGDSVTTIGDSAFYHCVGMNSITIGSSVRKIGYQAFRECTGLTKTNYTGTIADWCKIKVRIADNTIYYSHNFYINDVEIKDLVIPDGVDTIGNNAFYGCSGLTSVTIPNSVTTIGEDAFRDCTGLTSVTIPYSVETIQTLAFWGCKGLKSVTIHSNKICQDYDMNSTFGTQVEEFIIGDSVTTIGEDAFYINVLYNYN